jgi:pimeloyl-ACP methyl ester carboxylesterase
VGIAVGAAPASASPAGWQPCLYAAIPYDCKTFDFPIDRTGAVPGDTKVSASFIGASEGPRMGTIFVIAGGPGQSSQAMVDLMMAAFEGANRYDIVAVDQRGSGYSEPLNCPRLESGAFKWDGGDPKTDQPFIDCSNSLGPKRSGYNTAEAVEDLDAIRADLGVQNATFFGVSYGTKVALAYAQAHPDHTKALMIDSVLPTDMPGQFDTDSIAASRTALKRICAEGRCRGLGSSPVKNMASLAARLEKKPVKTFFVSPTGKVSETEIDAVALMDTLFSADLNFFIYNQLPSMLRSSLDGNDAQLTRLYAIINGQFASSDSLAGARKIAKTIPKSTTTPTGTNARKPGDRVAGRDAYALSQFSNTMFFATTCADFKPPWTRSNDVSNRQPAIDAAANAIPSSDFYPFSRTTARNDSTSAYCRGWQQAPTPPAIAPGPLPNVPTLALEGDLDLRTPSAWAERAIAGNPSAQLVHIPNSGHSVIGTDVSGCALSLAKRFLIFGATDGKCKETSPPVPVAPLPQTSIKQVRSLRGSCRGLRGAACTLAKRQMLAGYLGFRDTMDQALIGGMGIGPGLYDGLWEMEFDLNDNLDFVPVSLRLTAISSVPGVFVSGAISIDGLPSIDDQLRIAGYRVDITGRIAYDRSGDAVTLSGRKGRNRVSINIRPSSTGASKFSASTAALQLRRSYTQAAGTPVSSPLAQLLR